MNDPKLLDNSAPQFQIKTYLTGLLTSNEYSELSVATGYWDLPGMLEMLPAFEVFLDANEASKIRFLGYDEFLNKSFAKKNVALFLSSFVTSVNKLKDVRPAIVEGKG